MKELWKFLHDPGISNYLDNVLILEIMLENRKELFRPLIAGKEITLEEVQAIEKTVRAARSELKKVARVSLYTKCNLKKALSDLIKKNILDN